MRAVKEITVFSIGDSLRLSTWSNVPYFFTRSLEEQGIFVNRVNLEENRALAKLYKYSVYAVFKLISRDTDQVYFRSGLNYFLTNLKIKRALKQYGKADARIFLTYSFSSGPASGKRTVLFSDWSYLYRIREFSKRRPFWFEKASLKREEKHINEADFVISLFPGSKIFNDLNYQNQNCHYLGNVINAFQTPDKQALMARKQKSTLVLFIGNKKYLQGARDLASAVETIRGRNSKIELHMIGLDESDLALSQDGLFCHGYLDKEIAAERDKYYDLISAARLIVNTTAGWGAFSAMTEAMYYYTPVVTTPYPEFLNTYGAGSRFGYFVDSNAPAELAAALEKVLRMDAPEYAGLMEGAHENVKDFTWQKYAEKLVKLIS